MYHEITPGSALGYHYDVQDGRREEVSHVESSKHAEWVGSGYLAQLETRE